LDGGSIRLGRVLEGGAEGALADRAEGVLDFPDGLAGEAERDGFLAELVKLLRGSHVQMLRR
jgi:hypothetical protein